MIFTGRVQGVGFRPYLFRLAGRHGITGWVRNRTGSVEVHIQGNADALQAFVRELLRQPPPPARPRLESCTPVEPCELKRFLILESNASGEVEIHVPPDLSTCDDCLAELDDPHDRRHGYPFINCARCGPRYTLIRRLPYDRANTTMADFALCDACRREYEDPHDRRFHAEPVACPACGPTLEFRVRDGTRLRNNTPALNACIAALREGRIVAVKGVGGYHLMCDASSDAAIARLRATKPRPHKPLAVMFPAPAGDPLAHARNAVHLSGEHGRLLQDPARPIVLAPRKPGCTLSPLIAPGLNEIGLMLPYSPLHHLLLNAIGLPLVATSANISGEPVLTENSQVEERLNHVAEAFLHHDRPIERPADDPVYRFIQGRARPLRTGRGCAPLEQELPCRLTAPVLAVGGHMKNTVALAWRNRIVISPHIGDMGTARSLAVFERTVEDLQSLYGVPAAEVICDAHPGYVTTHWAERCGLPVRKVFHHHAHAAVACGSAPLDGLRLVFTWDGVGYGEDGSLWGGETLLGRPGTWRRIACLRPFHLPGGERAGREPWRSAAALCWETGRDWPALSGDTGVLRRAWQRRVNAPRTTAAGRLFDAAAALTGVCREASFEGQAPMLLEAACEDVTMPVELPLRENGAGLWQVDWAPLIPMLLDTTRPVAERAACFHASLAHAMLRQARQARKVHGVKSVGLAGGVFQNRVLTEAVVALLEEDGYTVHYPDDIPVNDAGLSLGQVIEYAFARGNSVE
jgi:hydrogenase maturation protein HypF